MGHMGRMGLATSHYPLTTNHYGSASITICCVFSRNASIFAL